MLNTLFTFFYKYIVACRPVARQRFPKETRKQQLHCNAGTVFSKRSVPRCHTQDKLGAGFSEELVVELVN
jgi:uncharacterized membrane protein